MDLAVARSHIQTALERMRLAYGSVVFDEWALLAMGAKHGGVLAYVGPRVESFRLRFAADVDPLRTLAAEQPLTTGDFVFVPEATGTRYDALMRVGDGSFLICNNTTKTVLEIRAESSWLRAQPAFFELGEKFRADPLVVA